MKFDGRHKLIFDADDEEPNCLRCTKQQGCEFCGPKYGWYNYEREICTKEDLLNEDK